MSTRQPPPLNIDQIVAIKTPESLAWSPDGSQLAYCLAGFEHGEIWLGNLGGEPGQLTEGDEPAGPPVWDGVEHIVFTRGTSVRRVSVHGGEQTILTLPEEATRATILPSGDAVVYVLDGDAWLWCWFNETAIPEPVRMTEDQWLMTRLVHRITDVFYPSPDGMHVAIACPREHSLDLAVYSRDTGTLHWIMLSDDPSATLGASYTAAVWSPDGKRLAFTRYDWRVKWRELWVADPTGNDPQRIWRDESKQWVSRFQFDAAFSPHGNYLTFVAPIDNFGQILVAHTNNVNEPKQISEPGSEAEKPRWSPDGNWISYFCNDRGQLARQMARAMGEQPERGWTAPHGAGHAHLIGLTHPEKRLHVVNALHRQERHDQIHQAYHASDYCWSPAFNRIAVIMSHFNQPDHVVTLSTDSWSVRPIADHNDGLNAQVNDVQVGATAIPSEDERWQIPVLFMQRRDVPRDGSAPGVIYIHGGGQGQYAVAGWQGYSGAGTTYAANMMLAQMGYVVCIVDYRGSWNYGRDYETASYLDVGGGDLRDVVAATRSLGKQPQVDPQRIGVWGRSYGGFLTTLCMVKEPELYAAGVNLVGVFNWLDYYHYLSDRAPGAWSRSRFALPDEHPDLYRERNPLEYIDNLSAPYLALYGNDDANVPIDHCWQMVRALTEANKDFDLVIYPDEPHIFTRSATWRDALQRVVRHFDAHV